LQGEFVLPRRQRDHLIAGQGAQYVDELASPHRRAEGALITAKFGCCAHLNFKITGGEFHAGAVFAQKHIGQDGQGVAPLHDARDRLQGTQQLFLRCFENNHDVFQFLKVVVVVGRGVGCGKRDFRLFFQ